MRKYPIVRRRRTLLGAVTFAVFVGSIGGVVALPASPAAGADCSQTSVGFTPLTDSVGLYDASNATPESHAAAAPSIEPIDGVVGVASLGMSNAKQEWAAFMSTASGMEAISPSVRLANGAVGGKTMSEWSDPNDPAWNVALDRINADGLSPTQVQIIWMKMGSQLGQLAGTTAERVEQERVWLEETIANAKVVFPNLKRVYMSSRIYAGYNSNPNHNEPETGFDNGLSVRAVASDALVGKSAVWTAWGPYLWADGTTPRSDGVTWECSDYESDGIHPSVTGEQKVVDLLVSFFTGDVTACEWFLANEQDCGAEISPPCSGGTCSDGGRFVDVPATNIFFADIEWLADAGITKGCNPPDNTKFCPDAPVKRGQMAAFIDRALDLPAGPDVFSDVSDSVFLSNINALAAAGITKGCNPPDNDRFCPDEVVSRGQMAAFIARALGLTSAGVNTFVDDDTSIFESDIEALAASGITKGCNPPDNDRFCPEASVTRAQMAAFLHRAEPWLYP
ncbi:MAG: S-layer homology domain-containing protein [Actinomycetota bacterium]